MTYFVQALVRFFERMFGWQFDRICEEKLRQRACSL